jgi:Sortase domain
MKSTTTANGPRGPLALPPRTVGAGLRAVTAAVVLLVGAPFVAGCAPTPALPEAPPAVPASPVAVEPAPGATADAATPPAATPAPAAAPASVPRPDIPLRQASLAPAAATDPAPRFLTVAGTTISMDIVEVSVTPDGAMEIPEAFDEVGWYRHGPAPGAAAGAAVLAAHVDTTSDLAPFSQLKSLAAGTRVTVDREGAPALNYRVVSVDLMAKDRFDGAALFRRDGPHELKLVTCGGRWLDEKLDYSDNVIVTAVLE